MARQVVILVLFVFTSLNLYAQKGNNGLSVNGEVTLPIYQDDRGFGFFVKGMYGVGRSAQLTASLGVSRLKNRNTVEEAETRTRLVPFLLGYKQNMGRFFIEPKVGIGELGGRIQMDGDYARPSVTALFGGLGAGYSFRRFAAGISFQTAHGIDNSSAGLWHDRNFHYTSVFLGYELFGR